MNELPLTRIAVDEKKQTSIRNAVRNSESIAGRARIAREEDVEALTALLLKPEISDPIYTLPQVINQSTTARFIKQHLDERDRGEGLLMIGIDEKEIVRAYYDIKFWPQWAACELGGAVDSPWQNKGRGGADAATAFGWLFEVIGVNLICETAAIDNVRTARLLERIGFIDKGVIQSQLADGGVRPSRYWELNKADWR